MEMNDFSALIQLTATLTIAFVAVEYVKSYTRVVCNRIFGLEKTVTEAFKECVDCLIDDETLKNIKTPNIEGKSTNNIVQKVQVENETLRKNISDLQEEKLAAIGTVCRARSMSSLCFFLFMSNTLLLFMASLEGRLGIYIHIACIVLCCCSVLYLLIGWWLGEKANPVKFCNFTTLKHPMYGVGITVGLTIIAVVFAKVFINNPFIQNVDGYWWMILLAFLIVSFLNFVMFVFKIRSKALGFLDDIDKLKGAKKKECEDAQSDIKDLMGACRLNDKLKSDSKSNVGPLIAGVTTKESPSRFLHHPSARRYPGNNNLIGSND